MIDDEKKLLVWFKIRALKTAEDSYPRVLLISGRCRIRTRVDGFEARQDIQATLIALSLARHPPFLKKAEGLARLWGAHYRVFQWGAPPVAERQPCH